MAILRGGTADVQWGLHPRRISDLISARHGARVTIYALVITSTRPTTMKMIPSAHSPRR